LLEEVGYYIDQPPLGELYCDVGKIFTLEITNLEQLPNLASQGFFGVKGYLFPPSSTIQCIPSNLNIVFAEMAESQLTLFIDPTLPNPRMLYNSSPNRLSTLEERFESKNIDSTKTFAAAFPDAIESDGSEEENPEETPKKRFRRQTHQTKSKTIKPVINRSISSHAIVEQNVGYTKELPIPEILEEDDDIKPNGTVKKTNYTIFDDLDKRIKENQANIENLCKAEQFTYENSGSTSYSSTSPVASKNDGFSSILALSPKADVKIQNLESSTLEVPNQNTNNVYQSRISKKRPSALLIKTELKSSKERIYLYHLANFPDS